MKRCVHLVFVGALAACHTRGLGSAGVDTGEDTGGMGTGGAGTVGPGEEPCADGCFERVDDVALPMAFGGRLFVGDFDGDGRDDIVDVRGVILFGDAVDPFQTVQELELVGGSLLVAAGDVDGDGRTDVFGRGVDGELLVVLGAADRSFSAKVAAPDVRPVTGAAFAHDVDGDGLADLALITEDGRLEVLRGQADGTLVPSWSFDLPGPADMVTGGHIDDDGHVDLLVPGEDTQRLFLGRGDGTFEGPAEFLERPGLASVPFRSPAAVGLTGSPVAACSQGVGDRSCGMGLVRATAMGFELMAGVELGIHTVGLEVGDFRGDGRGSIVGHSTSTEPGDVLRLVCATDGVYGLCDEIVTEQVDTFTGLDVDGDGLDDLVVVWREALGPSRVLQVYRSRP